MSLALTVLALVIPGPPPDLREEKHTMEIPVDPRVKVVRPYNAKLDRMAWCESRRRWHIATGNGFFGGLQFDAQTWRSVGGRGLPHWYSQLEQKYRAVKLIRVRGYAPWPVCGSA